MLKFRIWVEDQEDWKYPTNQSEYDPPDEQEMDHIRLTPIKCDNPPNLHGDAFRFTMPMGNRKEFVILRGSVAGLKAPRGSLNAKCFDLLNKGKLGQLYQFLHDMKFSNNSTLHRQIISYS